MYGKKFLEWIGLKEVLDSKESTIPHVSQGQIWWASLGENVGKEINGKSDLFTRPVLIFKKLSRDFYLVIPLTSQERFGTWYVNFSLRGKSQAACLHQIRALDCKRLSTRLGWIDDSDYQKVKAGFLQLYS